MSFLQAFGASAIRRSVVKSRSKKPIRRGGRDICRRRALGFETMEGRRLLSAVSIDRSGDPGQDSITMVAYGPDTYIDVNAVQVYSGPSTAISSLTIIGSNYNDTISIDYGGGNPVPDGTMTVNGYGGAQNQIDVTANANVTLGSNIQLFGNVSSTINYTNIQSTKATAASASDHANLLQGGASAGVFYGHLATSVGAGPGANFQAGDGSYNNMALGFGTVDAYSSNVADVAYLDDYYAGINNAVAQPTVGWFGGATLEDVVNGFAHAHFYAGDTQDLAFLDDQNDTSAATGIYTPLDANYSGPGYANEAAGFPNVHMTGYNASDVVNIGDNGAQGSFGSTNTEASIWGNDGGEAYAAYADFAHVYLWATYGNDTATWSDSDGGATVSVGQNGPYISYGNAGGSIVTGIGFGWFDITAENFTEEPAIRDYITQTAVQEVATYPQNSEPFGHYWEVIPDPIES